MSWENSPKYQMSTLCMNAHCFPNFICLFVEKIKYKVSAQFHENTY